MSLAAASTTFWAASTCSSDSPDMSTLTNQPMEMVTACAHISTSQMLRISLLMKPLDMGMPPTLFYRPLSMPPSANDVKTLHDMVRDYTILYGAYVGCSYSPIRCIFRELLVDGISIEYRDGFKKSPPTNDSSGSSISERQHTRQVVLLLLLKVQQSA
ncbi:hypothetical protein FRC14_005419 [Serendipita sp. 396]|nr:hypothetical protein FRC14_005419 [Serendipita sp. 396]